MQLPRKLMELIEEEGRATKAGCNSGVGQEKEMMHECLYYGYTSDLVWLSLQELQHFALC
jgi:hypothetical protein